ncbi:hypothetical protein GCM10009085_20960 [Pseudomonas avellanae]|nr:hypothetical protein GCM10009085_20960 [Pseudomonas avellanae]
MLKHPLAQSLAFGAGSHFIRQSTSITATACDVQNHRAQKQNHHFNVPLGDFLNSTVLCSQVVSHERVPPLFAGALPCCGDATSVVFNDARKAVDDGFSDGFQTQYSQYKGTGLGTQRSPNQTTGNSAQSEKKYASACSGRPSDKSTAYDDHGHLGNDIDQVFDDAGDVEIDEPLSQYAASLPFGTVERGPNAIETAHDQCGRRDGFISVCAKMAPSVGRDIAVKLSPYAIP